MEIILDQSYLGVRVFVVLAEGLFLALNDPAGSKHGNAHPRLVLHEGVGLDGRVGGVLEEAEIHTAVFAVHIGIS